MRRWNRRWLAAGILLLVILAIAAIGLLRPDDRARDMPSLAEQTALQNTGPAGASLTVGKVFTPVAENDRLALAVNDAGQIRVTDRGGRHEWFSNPQTDALALEEVQGYWRHTLESPFVIEYLDLKGISTEVITANSADLDAAVSFHELESGIEIAFDLRKINIRFSYLVRLADDHLEISIPYDRIVESGDTRLVSLWVMPMFGAMQGATNTGYMFVPDGIGALIPFDPTTRYSYSYSSRSIYEGDVLYPVFGMASGDKAFVGIIDEGEFTAEIAATPGGMYTTFNWVTPQFVYREDYFKLTSLFGSGFQVFQEEKAREDRRIRYYFLSGDDANYAGMARAYRHYLMEAKGLERRTEASYPLDLYVMGGDREKALVGKRLVPVTTFDQAGQMIRSLAESGVEPIDVTYRGWENNGYLQDTPGRFPPSKALGGAGGLAELARQVHSSGGKLYLADNFAVAYSSNNGFNPKNDAVRDDNGKVISDDLGLGVTEYFVQPYLAWHYLQDSFARFRDLTVDGLYHEGIGKTVFSDESPSRPIPRKETAAVFEAMLADTSHRLGEARADHGNAYALPYVSHIGRLPFDTSYDMLASIKVPFYPIALHGLVSYSGIPLNLQDEGRTGFLNTLEYGALPAYLLTHDDPAALKHTLSDSIYSSRFEEWREQAIARYSELKSAIGTLGNQFIEDHRELAQGVYETVYEDGTSVIVNYTRQSYRAGDREVLPENYSIARGVGRG
ncbi:DUF5696 domain-containing protein [Paenibacillaceae bacterium WGS1546]|uniref:DUF5696 domain-containing protein n=1 Tax=Cohnella sp. WGS1546 TaxID=3366810 RepID=UPI00372D2C63